MGAVRIAVPALADTCARTDYLQHFRCQRLQTHWSIGRILVADVWQTCGRRVADIAKRVADVTAIEKKNH